MKQQVNASGPMTDEEAQFAFPNEKGTAGSSIAEGNQNEVRTKSVKEVRWLTDRKRVERYHLDWPFEVDGVEYRTIVIRRMSFDEITAFLEKVQNSASEKSVRFPLYTDEHGNLISDEIWEIIEADDRFKLVEIARDFLPAIFRGSSSETGSGESPAP